MDQKITGWIDTLLNTGVGWGNKLFEFFGLYSSKYAGWIIGIIALYVVSQFVNLKAIFGGGKR